MNKADRFLEHLMIDFIRKGIIIGKLQRWYQKHEHSWWLKLIKWIHPNHLTLSRAVVFTPLVVYCLIIQQKTAALVFWIGGWFMDMIDGPWAVVTNRQTTGGKILDPVCDRIYTMAVIITTLIIYPLPLVVSLSLGLFLLLELVLPGLYLAVRLKCQKEVVPPHNACGKLKACSISFALPLIWFSQPETSWQFVLGGLTGIALLTALFNIAKNFVSGHLFVKSPD